VRVWSLPGVEVFVRDVMPIWLKRTFLFAYKVWCSDAVWIDSDLRRSFLEKIIKKSVSYNY
jgi:hypothetical protein